MGFGSSAAKLSAALHQPLDPLAIVQIRLKCYQISVAIEKEKTLHSMV